MADREQMRGQPLIVGLALDVSGSMKSNIQNQDVGDVSRLDGLKKAMAALLAEARRLSAWAGAMDHDRVKLFAYVYGLNIASVQVCDLFLLLQAWQSVAEQAKLAEYRDALISHYTSRAASDRVQLAREVMGSNIASLMFASEKEAERIVRNRIEEVITDKVRRRGAGFLIHGLRSIEQVPTTFNLQELAERWTNVQENFGFSNPLLGGATPMKQCLEIIEARFQQEKAVARAGTRFVLFIVSDGQSTDGDPGDAAKRLRDQGVEIASCFVSAADEIPAKELFEREHKEWGEGAKAMFALASTISSQSPEGAFLLRGGWRFRKSTVDRWVQMIGKLFGRNTPDWAKLFAQVNNSAVLDEFLRVVIAPLYAEHGGE